MSKNEKPSKTTVFTMVLEGLGLPILLKFEDFRSKYALQNRSGPQLFFHSIFYILMALLVTFAGRFGAFWSLGGSLGLLEDFGHRLASTWGPWVQLGRLGLPFWSQKSIFD